MFGGGGAILLVSHGAMNGAGGQSVFGDYPAFHYYGASHKAAPFIPTPGLQKMGWEDGWPTVNQSVKLPALVSAPRPATVREGHKTHFTASATGTPEPVAVWESPDDDGATWQPADATQRAVRGQHRHLHLHCRGEENPDLRRRPPVPRHLLEFARNSHD